MKCSANNKKLKCREDGKDEEFEMPSLGDLLEHAKALEAADELLHIRLVLAIVVVGRESRCL